MTPLLNYSGTALAGNTFVTICQHLIYVRKVRTYFQRMSALHIAGMLSGLEHGGCNSFLTSLGFPE